ncbi:MAG: hypothetical protein ACK41Q_02490 [Candidatus Brocadia sp.]
MIQGLFRHKTFASVFITLGLTLRPLRLCGKLLFFLFFTFIISISPSAILFAEGSPGKNDIPTTQKTEDEAWTGIDVSIVGKYATKYGHPPSEPYINTDQGDLLLFVFTVAGVVGGFIIGFNARRLFYEK